MTLKKEYLCDRCGEPIEADMVTVNEPMFSKDREYHFHKRRCYTSWCKDTAESAVKVYGDVELDDGPGKPVERDEWTGAPIAP